MPIEIRELYIKAVVQDIGCNTDSTNSGNNSSAASPDHSTNAIIDRCVEQVLAILKEKQER